MHNSITQKKSKFFVSDSKLHKEHSALCNDIAGNLKCIISFKSVLHHVLQFQASVSPKITNYKLLSIILNI